MRVKNTPSSGHHLAVDDRPEGRNPTDDHSAKLDRLARGKARGLEMASYLRDKWASSPREVKEHQPALMLARDAGSKLLDCGNYLEYRQYYTKGEFRLTKMHSCRQFRICPLCATRRASKMMSSYLARYEIIKAANPKWRAYLITLTVKDGANLLERFEHLKASHQLLQARRRKGHESIWGRIHGAVGAYETTIGKGSGLWHPHAHIVVFADTLPLTFDANGNPRCLPLEEEWEGITHDSKVVDVRPFDDAGDSVKSFCEVFKYALKFSEMTCAQNWEANQVLARRKLTFSYGCFRGVKVPEELTDEPLNDLPYVELFYRYVGGAYSLKSQRHVMPETSENAPDWTLYDTDAEFDEYVTDKSLTAQNDAFLARLRGRGGSVQSVDASDVGKVVKCE